MRNTKETTGPLWNVEGNIVMDDAVNDELFNGFFISVFMNYISY